jgi:hypothetical protein
MRSLERKNKKKKIIIISGLLITLVLCIGAYALYKNSNDTFNTEKPIRSQDEINNPYDQSALKENLPEKSVEEIQNPNPPKIDPTYAIRISDFSQANGVVSIRSVVDAPNKGTCTYTLSTIDAKPVIREALNTGSDGPKYCNIEIPEVEFAKIGVWKLTIGFTSTGKTNEVSQDVTIK